MKKEEVLGKVIFDYRDFFKNKDVENYKEEISKFHQENASLTEDEFFKLFNEKFGMTETLHKALSREYLSRISSSVKTIKNIIIVYFILSIIAAIVLLAN